MIKMRKLNVKHFSTRALLPFEKETFKVIPIYGVPYYRKFLEDRLLDYRKAVAEHKSVKEYFDMVMERYAHAGLTKDMTEHNAWGLMHQYEYEYRKLQPDDGYFIRKKTHHNTTINRELLAKSRRKLRNRRMFK